MHTCGVCFISVRWFLAAVVHSGLIKGMLAWYLTPRFAMPCDCEATHVNLSGWQLSTVNGHM